MRIAIALGGNALLKRGEPLTAEVQRANVKAATRAIAPLARDHQLILSHGNGPQVGLLALQAASYQQVPPYPLDVLDAQTEGMIGYMIEQELDNAIEPDIPFATLLTMIEVNPEDPAFGHPTKFVGPVYQEEEARRIERELGWTFRKDGEHWRRVVPSPLPKRIIEVKPIRWLLERGTIVICTGGGGIPCMRSSTGTNQYQGVEAVIDKDRASALLAREVDADLLVLATDVKGVYLEWGTPHARLIRHVTPNEMRYHQFAPGSMGPKVDAACQFVEETGNRAVIGALGEILAMVEGTAGTSIEPEKL